MAKRPTAKWRWPKKKKVIKPLIKPDHINVLLPQNLYVGPAERIKMADHLERAAKLMEEQAAIMEELDGIYARLRTGEKPDGSPGIWRGDIVVSPRSPGGFVIYMCTSHIGGYPNGHRYSFKWKAFIVDLEPILAPAFSVVIGTDTYALGALLDRIKRKKEDTEFVNVGTDHCGDIWQTIFGIKNSLEFHKFLIREGVVEN